MSHRQRNDLEYQWLVDRGATPAQLADMWLEDLSGLGYRGSLSDMLHDFSAGGGA